MPSHIGLQSRIKTSALSRLQLWLCQTCPTARVQASMVVGTNNSSLKRLLNRWSSSWSLELLTIPKTSEVESLHTYLINRFSSTPQCFMDCWNWWHRSVDKEMQPTSSSLPLPTVSRRVAQVTHIIGFSFLMPLYHVVIVCCQREYSPVFNINIQVIKFIYISILDAGLSTQCGSPHGPSISYAEVSQA